MTTKKEGIKESELDGKTKEDITKSKIEKMIEILEHYNDDYTTLKEEIDDILSAENRAWLEENISHWEDFNRILSDAVHIYWGITDEEVMDYYRDIDAPVEIYSELYDPIEIIYGINKTMFEVIKSDVGNIMYEDALNELNSIIDDVIFELEDYIDDEEN